MAHYRNTLPQMADDLFLVYVGMETDLIFSQGMDLPGFASYPLMESAEGRATLTRYFNQLIATGEAAGVGVVLESPTWVANADRGAGLGYDPQTLNKLTVQSLALMEEARRAHSGVPVVLSANIGPRADAYAPNEQMTVDEAQAYHATQINVLPDTATDLISAYTLAYPQEAIGIVRAAQMVGMPVVVSFTVETDGTLPTGMSLQQAIEEVDRATDGYASYFMINCAHPDHFDHVLSDAAWMSRLKGVVANASRCSHAELDNATELDAGDPTELGTQLAGIRRRYPNITVLGGCCGTDMRHIEAIVRAAL